MNKRVAVRVCGEYFLDDVEKHISDIYRSCEGPELRNRKVLLKPNILSDHIPEKCISTHPVVVEAMIRFLRSEGAEVVIGDSPAVHLRGFRPVKSGIYGLCEKYGVPWVDFTKNPSEVSLRNGKIKIASVTKEVDLIISLPKLKNHDLVYFTGAVKNSLGLVPSFSKAKQHALHQNRESFARFLVDLSEAVAPHFYLMDGIVGMEGAGPGQGTPFRTEVLIGSSNPVALDIIASTIAGYNPLDIPTNRVALSRELWLKSPDEIQYNGPELKSLIRMDFRRIPIASDSNISFRFLKSRLHFLKKLERRPVFIRSNCTDCRECVKICPVNAITPDAAVRNHIILNDRKCIRCFCCSEVCRSNAVVIKRKLFGV
ncbi:MAG: DUF362 domain-containing protein [Bacteroidales bacterium]